MSNVTQLPPASKTADLEGEMPSGQRDDFNQALKSIVAGERPLDVLDRDVADITRRAIQGLEAIEAAIHRHPGSGQGRRLVRFLAGVYHGSDYPFDLTEIRCLDSDLASACLDYLNYDRLSKAEVHKHLSGGDEQLHRWMSDIGLSPLLRLNELDEARLLALAVRAGDEETQLLKRAVEEFLRHREAKEFGGLRPERKNPDVKGFHHIRRLGNPITVPICGAKDGPWTAVAFYFDGSLCDECRNVLLTAPTPYRS